MLTSLEISNFRAFKSLKIDGLKRINLIGGKNSSGKTSVLEACELLFDCQLVRLEEQAKRRGLRLTPSFRQISTNVVDDPWANYFNRRNTKAVINISGTEVAGKRSVALNCAFDRSARLAVRDAIDARTSDYVSPAWIDEERVLAIETADHEMQTKIAYVFPDTNGQWSMVDDGSIYRPVSTTWPQDAFNGHQVAIEYGTLQKSGAEKPLLDALKILSPNLKSLLSITEGEGSSLWADFGDEHRVPLSLLGDGVVRLAKMMLSGIAQRGGFWLIDEIENGIHHSALLEVWRAVFRLARERNRQVVCTTHSAEMAVAAFEAGGDDVAYFRIDAHGADHEAVPYEKKDAEMTLEMGLDIR